MIQSSPVTGAAGYSPRRLTPRGRGLLLAVLALLAFAAGAVVAGLGDSGEQELARRYASALGRGDHRAMYDLLTADARRKTDFAAFREVHRRAAETATSVGARVARRGPGEAEDGVVRVPMRVRTRVFGTLRVPLAVPLTEEDGAQRVAWAPHVAFPGLRAGERLTRRTRLPTRAAIRAADGSLLAGGPGRGADDPLLAGSIAGQLGPVPPERAAELRALGVPDDAQVGVSGLERALDDEVRGRPGGEIRAGRRSLALTAPQPADAVMSTIEPDAQRAAVASLTGYVGGAVAMRPRTGEVVAAAGIGLSGLQPPGSTFKIITLAAALQARLTKRSRRYPVQTDTTLEGVRLENANGEACGGTLIETFAESCNTVFAPLGAELGAERLVTAAEAFGFNRPPGIDGAATSTIPPAADIGDDLAVGSSAIGQGRVQASALQMAVVAATIARRGERPVPTLLARARSRATRVLPHPIARTVAQAMRAVVREGTGIAAAIEGVSVAGKTGTAELRSTVAPEPQPGTTAVAPAPAADPTDTDAWFAAFAPYAEPRVAVGILLVEAGAGGTTAAPAARTLLEAALRRRG